MVYQMQLRDMTRELHLILDKLVLDVHLLLLTLYILVLVIRIYSIRIAEECFKNLFVEERYMLFFFIKLAILFLDNKICNIFFLIHILTNYVIGFLGIYKCFSIYLITIFFSFIVKI